MRKMQNQNTCLIKNVCVCGGGGLKPTYAPSTCTFKSVGTRAPMPPPPPLPQSPSPLKPLTFIKTPEQLEINLPYF